MDLPTNQMLWHGMARSEYIVNLRRTLISKGWVPPMPESKRDTYDQSSCATHDQSNPTKKRRVE